MAAGAPSQNGMAECSNQTLSNMVWCLLHLAALGPKYWSFALLHIVYLKNLLPHMMALHRMKAIGKSPSNFLLSHHYKTTKHMAHQTR